MCVVAVGGGDSRVPVPRVSDVRASRHNAGPRVPRVVGVCDGDRHRLYRHHGESALGSVSTQLWHSVVK